MISHGPCLVVEGQNADYALRFKSKYFSYQATPWSFRHSKQWPSNNVIDRIISYGSLVIPIGPKTLSENGLLWRLSFSVGEKLLILLFNFNQLLCYGLLKLWLTRKSNSHHCVRTSFCCYFALLCSGYQRK